MLFLYIENGQVARATERMTNVFQQQQGDAMKDTSFINLLQEHLRLELKRFFTCHMILLIHLWVMQHRDKKFRSVKLDILYQLFFLINFFFIFFVYSKYIYDIKIQKNMTILHNHIIK